jgi:hypothetical protein
MRTLIVAVVFALLSVSTSFAQASDQLEPPGDALLLVQSELEYLEVANQRISIDFKEASPEKALEQIGKKLPLVIEIQRTLPEEPKLTRSFRDAKVKEILQWFASEVSVSYHAERPNKLLVLCLPEARTP